MHFALLLIPHIFDPSWTHSSAAFACHVMVSRLHLCGNTAMASEFVRA